MDYFEVINIVQNEYLKANNKAKFEITEVKRKCLLSTDKEAFINNELMGIDYKKSAFGYYYIACNYFCGSTWLDMRDEITRYYLGHTDIFTDQRRIESDVYTFLFAFCLERELQQLKAAPEPQQKRQNVDEATPYYEKAVSVGLLEKVGTGYKRKGITKAQLAYFLGRVHTPDATGKDGKTFPETELNVLFGEKRLGQTLRELIDNKSGKPRGYKIIDALFD